MLGDTRVQPSLRGAKIVEALLANHSEVGNQFGFFIPTSFFLVSSVTLIAPSHEITRLPVGGVKLSLSPSDVDGSCCSRLAEMLTSNCG